MHLLVIEDDLTVQKVLIAFLRQEGHNVQAAGNLRQVEGHLSQFHKGDYPFDVILSDFWLESFEGKTSGRETYVLLRHYVGPNVPLLCASSDISMWEQVKGQHEDERMYTRRKQYGAANLNYWDKAWVKSTLAAVEGLPPLPKKNPRILLAGKSPSFVESTTRAMQDAGYEVSLCENIGDEIQNLSPFKGSPKYAAVISEFELAKGSGAELFLFASMKKPGIPFLATGPELAAWDEIRVLADSSQRAIHILKSDSNVFIARLKELGI